MKYFIVTIHPEGDTKPFTSFDEGKSISEVYLKWCKHFHHYRKSVTLIHHVEITKAQHCKFKKWEEST